MRRLILLLLLSLLTFAVSAENRKLNDRPIIAVLAERRPPTSNQSYIAASYVKYLKSAGARVVPIPHYFNESKIKELFKYVNGVLLPGGNGHFFISDFYHHAKQFWDLAIAANDAGNYFPMWGTCLGSQTLFTIRANEKVLTRRVASDIALPLNFTNDVKTSRLFKDIDKDLFAVLGSENVTYNHHNYGITPETYLAKEKLHSFFRILSLNNDVNGKEFISTAEAHKYPFYAILWHPEKVNFEFTTKLKGIPHDTNSVLVTQYVANFFVNEARKNLQKFPTKKMEDEYLIYRYTPIHSASKYKEGIWSMLEQIYLF